MSLAAPSRPSLSPALATGLYANPANAGKSLEDILKASPLPTFGSWEDALKQDWTKTPYGDQLAGNEGAQTNYLRSVYGLSPDYKVQNGQIVNAKNFVERNIGWLGPAALIGGSALGAAFSGAGAGAGVGAGVGASTGAGTTAAASATGAAAAAGAHGMTLGSLLTSPLFGQIPNLVGTVYGAKKQGQSNDLAAQLQRESLAQAQKLAEAQLAQQAAQFQAQQDLEGKKFASEQEQNAFTRQQAEFQRQQQEYEQQLIKDREARLAPFRQLQATTLAQLLQGGTPSLFQSPITSAYAGAR